MSIFMAGIIFFVILFVFFKMVQYYWKKTHPRRRKGEVSVNTERNESDQCQEGSTDIRNDCNLTNLSNTTESKTVSK